VSSPLEQDGCTVASPLYIALIRRRIIATKYMK
jgi:hypothetical protein